MRLVNLLIAVTIIMSASCVQKGDVKINGDMVEVWTGNGWPAKNMDTPESFTVSPWEAYQIAAKSKRISLKHKWICYRDNQYYFISDSFGKKNSAETVLKYGLKINGISGRIEN